MTALKNQTKSMRQLQREIKQEADRQEAERRKRQEIALLYNFQVNFFPTLIVRFLSIFLFITAFDVLNSDILAYKSFVPIMFQGSKLMILCKVLTLLILAYMGTPQIEAQATINGVKAHVDVRWLSQSMDEAVCASDVSTCGFHKYFWDIQTIRWEEIYYAKKSYKLFNPVIKLYDKNDNFLGFIYFSLLDKKLFFDFVREHAGDEHPLLKLDKGA